jgi:hypothetical protein
MSSFQIKKVLFESQSVHASVSFNLLRGVFSVKMEADAYGGALLLKGTAVNRTPIFLLIDADGLDIAFARC